VQQHLDFGPDIRHIDKYSGVMMAVFDRKNALTGININFEPTQDVSRLMNYVLFF